MAVIFNTQNTHTILVFSLEQKHILIPLIKWVAVYVHTHVCISWCDTEQLQTITCSVFGVSEWEQNVPLTKVDLFLCLL